MLGSRSLASRYQMVRQMSLVALVVIALVLAQMLELDLYGVAALVVPLAEHVQNLHMLLV